MTGRYFFWFKKPIVLFLTFAVSYVNADLIIKNGENLILNSTSSEILSAEGNLVIESGGTLQGASNTEIRVSGNWDNSAGGNYTHGNSKVFFTGSGVSTIKGNNHFHHLVVNKKDAASGQEYTGSEIQIESGSTQTISSQLIINGASIDNRLKIRSTTNGETHTLNASSAVYVEAWFLDVDDSIFLGNIDMPMDLDSTSIVGPIVGSGNNDGWIPNSPPTISLSVNSFIEDSSTLVAGTTVACSYEVGDVDNDELTVVFTPDTNLNNHYTLDTSAKKILLTQAAIDRINLGNSLDEISLTVSDGIVPQFAFGTPSVTAVDDSALFSGDTNGQGNEDLPITGTLTATDEEGLTDGSYYTVSTEPSHGAATINPVSGDWNYSPESHYHGLDNFTVTLTDDIGGTTEKTINLVINSVNDKPVFSIETIHTATEDQQYTYVVNATDVEEDVLTYSATNLPVWLGFDTATRTLSGTPLNEHVGDHNVTVTVTDGEEPAIEILTITVANTNDAPTISGSADETVDQDQPYSFTPTAMDVDKNHSLTFTIVNRPEWATFDTANGELTGTPSNTDVGVYPNIVISVSDGIVESPVSLASFSIAVVNVNDAPIIDPIGLQSAAENNLYEYSVSASDEDSSFSFSFGLLENPQGMVIDPASGVISWTPGDSVATGDVQVTVQVNDGSGAENATASRSFTISVTAENDSPIGEVVISGIVAQGQTLTVTNNLTDADGIGPISYQWQIDGVNVVGATQNTYLLSQSDINRAVRVVASYIDAQGTEESVISNTSVEMLNFALDQLADDIVNNTNSVYVAAGIDNISDENISSVNSALLKQGVTSQIQVQQLVDSYVVILDYAENNVPGANPPLIGDYSNIGITGLSSNPTVLSLLSDVIDLANRADIDRVDKLQSFIDAVLALLDHAENTTDNLTKAQLDLLGLQGVAEDNLSEILQIIAETNQQLDQLEIIQSLIDTVVASDIIQAYNADQINNSAPTLNTYLTLDLNHINSSNLDRVNSAISTFTASEIDSIDKIIALLNKDTDADTVQDIFDSFPQDASETMDLDRDSIGDNSDNCPSVANLSQTDFDSDSLGDACDPDEDNDGVLSAEDAFKFNANYSLDSDNDGMPDTFENTYGFDQDNAADKNSDSDGDGVTNVDEFLAGTNPRVNPNPGLPKLVIPSDIEVVSTGRMTTVDIGIATAIDGSQQVVQPVASFAGPFSAGRHEITWSATDTQGNQSKAVQVVKVLPLVNLTPSSLIAEGGTAEVSVVLSGDAADYPVEIPFTLSGSATEGEDYRLVDANGLFTIAQGREASFSVEIEVDDQLENNETIEITLNQPNKAVLGSVTQRSITIIDGNLPPQISIVVEQGQNVGRVIAVDKGNVTVTASVSDPNPEDSHQFDWQIESKQTAAVVSDKVEDKKQVLVLDPSQLEPGIFSITAKAEDDADVVATTEIKTDFRLMQVAPKLSAEEDSDGDGVSDADEGYADSDSDGIVDYMDNIVEPNLAPVGEDTSIVLQAAVGTKIVLGETAFSSAQNTVMVSEEQIINIVTQLNPNNSLADLDLDYKYPYGLYDFVVSGAIPGDSYNLVLPLEEPYIEGQVFRKYMGPKIGWQNFIENAKNALFSAAAVDAACPEPGSNLFESGIQPGHTCIQLYIEDGGPNDVDATANGIVTDPGGIAIFSKQGSAPSVKNSKLELDKSVITTRGDKAIATVTVADENGSFLEGVDIVASCNHCVGVNVGEFIYQGQGVYTAEIISSSWLSNGWVEVVVSNQFGSVSLEPKKLLVKLKRTGGCTIVSGQPADISLFLFLFIFTLFNYIKRRHH